MRIGELARRAGVGVETIRFYEHKGLLARPARPRGGGFRDYSNEALRRIAFIRSAQHLGFSLGEIVELLDLKAGDGTLCSDVRRRAEAKRQQVATKIANLERISRALDELIAACPGEGSARNCSILEAITSGDLHLHPMTEGDER